MNIYKAEKAIANKLKNNKILCYSKATKPAQTEEVSNIIKASMQDFAFADVNDSDLYFHQSILVSTNWNDNDDIFLPQQVWEARQTPNHKPTNFEHNSTKIVGHIVGNYAIDDNSQLIADDTVIEDLPSKFHILTNSVIYRIWHSDAEYQEKVAELIEDIDNDEMFVSMEAMFPDFSYGLTDGNGNVKIVARNENTAFLSEHLRAYGGTGYYEDFKIGRAPKNIRFIGKGYTKNPANKESVVFNKNNLFSFNSMSFAEKIVEKEKNGVLLNSKQISNGDLLMSENTKQIDELLTLSKEQANQIKALEAKLAEADIKKYEDQLTAAKEENKVLAAKLESHSQDIETLKTALSEKEASLKEVTEAKSEVEAAKAALEKDLDDVKAEAVYLARVAKFEALGFENAEANKKATIFATLSDEQFEEVIAQMKPYEKNSEDSKKKEDKQKMKAELADNDELDEEGSATAEKTDVDELEEEESLASAAASFEDEDDNDVATVTLASAVANFMKVGDK